MRKPRVLGIVLARMSSSRLPEKIIRPIGGIMVLEWVLHRIKQAKRLDDIIIATSHDSCDDFLQKLAEHHGVAVFRGNRDDVLKRFRDAAAWRQADVVVRINADNPFVDHGFIDSLVSSILTSGKEYVSYRMQGDVPVMLTSISFFTEAMTMPCLEKACTIVQNPSEREHVTLGIYTRPEIFDVSLIDVPTFAQCTDIRLTLDTPDDLWMLNQIAQNAGDGAWSLDAAQIVDLVNKHPKWIEAMKHQNANNPKNVR